MKLRGYVKNFVLQQMDFIASIESREDNDSNGLKKSIGRSTKIWRYTPALLLYMATKLRVKSAIISR